MVVAMEDIQAGETIVLVRTEFTMCDPVTVSRRLWKRDDRIFWVGSVGNHPDCWESGYIGLVAGRNYVEGETIDPPSEKLARSSDRV